MRFLSVVVLLCLSLGFSSFKTTTPPFQTGKYGGFYHGGEEGEGKYELTLKKDHTFRYFNNLDPENVVDISGTWKWDGKTVSLVSKGNEGFPDKWRVDKKHKCLKSRKGLAFIRICHYQSCK